MRKIQYNHKHQFCEWAPVQQAPRSLPLGKRIEFRYCNSCDLRERRIGDVTPLSPGAFVINNYGDTFSKYKMDPVPLVCYPPKRFYFDLAYNRYWVRTFKERQSIVK